MGSVRHRGVKFWLCAKLSYDFLIGLAWNNDRE